MVAHFFKSAHFFQVGTSSRRTKFLKSQLASESTMQKDNRVDFSEFPPGALVLRTSSQKAARYWIDYIKSRQSWILRILIRRSCLFLPLGCEYWKIFIQLLSFLPGLPMMADPLHMTVLSHLYYFLSLLYVLEIGLEESVRERKISHIYGLDACCRWQNKKMLYDSSGVDSFFVCCSASSSVLTCISKVVSTQTKDRCTGVEFVLLQTI